MNTFIGGTRPARHIHKEKKWHDHYFGTSPAVIPDFNVDIGLTIPDQAKDNAFYECVGYTVSDILTDMVKSHLDPDFSYAAARYIAGDGAEGTQGTSFHAGLQGAVAVGALAKSLSIISAEKNGEAFISNWDNWLDSLKETARDYVQNGLMNVLGQGDDFDSILSALYTGKIGISIGTPWYEEWSSDIQQGVVQTPHNALNIDGLGWHNWAIKGKKTINGIPHLIGKTWQGTRVGDNGWLYFSRETINDVLSVLGTGAITLNPNANRWVSLWGIVAQRFPLIMPLLPELLSIK